MFATMEKELCLGFYNTPPLWINAQFGVPQFTFPKLDLSKYTAKQIPQQLRLGHKMEYIFEHLINYSDDWKLLAKNLLVDVNNQRIGELDFLLEHSPGKVQYHIELAYKFYIINPKISEPIHRLMGPNKRDMFFTKLDKLKEKQFPLLYTDALKQSLAQLQINTKKVKQHACFKAQLFLPYGATTTSIRPLNKNCIVGSWVHFNDFNTDAFKACEYYMPYKQEWVFTPSLDRNYISHYKTLLEINLRLLKENSPMLWMKKPDDTIEKLFVVWW